MAEFRMPILGADMQAGTLVAWRRQPGDRVARGDVVAEVETEKGLIEVEVFLTGVLERLIVPPGTTVPVGTVLAIVREDGAAVAPPDPSAPPPVRPAIPAVIPAPGPAIPAERPRISPAARALAGELGVDLDTVRGTGPGGSVIRADIEQAHAARMAGQAPPGASARAVASAGQLRQTIAAVMARSKREIPHYYVATTVDLEASLAWLRAENARRPVAERLLPAVVLLRAVARAVREVPELNAHILDGQVRPREEVHLGVAIALRQGGLVAPALHDADRRPLAELMASFRDLVTRARAGRLRSSELGDPTITVTSLGDLGVETVFGIIYPPQVAIVGFGKIVERPWVVGGQIVARPTVAVTLSADHRATDGHRGGRFLAAVDRLLQSPSEL